MTKVQFRHEPQVKFCVKVFRSAKFLGTKVQFRHEPQVNDFVLKFSGVQSFWGQKFSSDMSRRLMILC